MFKNELLHKNGTPLLLFSQSVPPQDNLIKDIYNAFKACSGDFLVLDLVMKEFYICGMPRE